MDFRNILFVHFNPKMLSTIITFWALNIQKIVFNKKLKKKGKQQDLHKDTWRFFDLTREIFCMSERAKSFLGTRLRCSNWIVVLSKA